MCLHLSQVCFGMQFWLISSFQWIIICSGITRVSSNGHRISKIVTMHDIRDNMRNAFFKTLLINFYLYWLITITIMFYYLRNGQSLHKTLPIGVYLNFRQVANIEAHSKFPSLYVLSLFQFPAMQTQLLMGFCESHPRGEPHLGTSVFMGGLV